MLAVDVVVAVPLVRMWIDQMSDVAVDPILVRWEVILTIRKLMIVGAYRADWPCAEVDVAQYPGDLTMVYVQTVVVDVESWKVEAVSWAHCLPYAVGVGAQCRASWQDGEVVAVVGHDLLLVERDADPLPVLGLADSLCVTSTW